jgi:hypothetical protein
MLKARAACSSDERDIGAGGNPALHLRARATFGLRGAFLAQGIDARCRCVS